MTIVKKKYLPFITNWEGSVEYPRKEHESNHFECRFLNEVSHGVYKCMNRDVIVVKTEMHCCCFKDKRVQFKTGNTLLLAA